MKTPVNYTQKGTPYGVRVHATLWSVEGRKETKKERASFGLLGGALFLTVKRSSCRTQKGTPYGVGVHVDKTGVVEEDVIGKEGLQETM